MITRVTGQLNRLLDEEARLQVGAIEYQLLIPDFVRRQIQGKQGEQVAFYTSQFLEGNPMQGRMVPRLIGFVTEVELEFFDLFCTVDKVGTRKAMKALVRPIREIANAIQRQDAKWLTTLPGIGPATAEQIIASLRRKVTKFALMPTVHEGAAEGEHAHASIEGNLLEDAYQALLSVGHNPVEARNRLDKVLATKKSFKTVEDVLMEIYRQSE